MHEEFDYFQILASILLGRILPVKQHRSNDASKYFCVFAACVVHSKYFCVVYVLCMLCVFCVCFVLCVLCVSACSPVFPLPYSLWTRKLRCCDSERIASTESTILIAWLSLSDRVVRVDPDIVVIAGQVCNVVRKRFGRHVGNSCRSFERQRVA